MSQEIRKKVYLIYGAALSLLILVVGICLIVSCLDIYRSGDSPYSPESIAAHFDRIKFPVFLLIDLLIAGILLSVVLPLERQKTKAVRDEAATLARLKSRLGGTASEKEAKTRLVLRVGSAVLIAFSAVYPTIYLATSANFGLEDLNGDIQKAAIIVLSATAFSMAIAALCSHLCRRSVRRETEACKHLLAMQAESPVKLETAEKSSFLVRFKGALAAKKKPIVLVVRLVLLAVAVVFIVLGVINGGIDDVLSKAARICTECIGLG